MRETFAHPKKLIRIGCWNVRTMNDLGKPEQVYREMRNYNLDILGIIDCRWTGFGRTSSTTKEQIIYSGKEGVHKNGVAIILSEKAAKSLIQWKPISDRIITARFYSKHIKTTIIQVYAPQNGLDDNEKDEFYEQLQKVYETVPKHDSIIVLGDLNAKIGLQMRGEGGIVGRHGLKGERTNNGWRFVSFCEINNIAITSTMFPHKEIHKYTWTSPDGATKNQIDHIAVNSTFRRSVLDVRSYRGADVGSDHNLVIGLFKLKLAKTLRTSSKRQHYNLQNLKCSDVRQKFSLELRNRFFCLRDNEETESNETPVESPITTIEHQWKNIKNNFNQTAKDVLGLRKGKSKPWITNETWLLIEERKILKKKVDDAKSARIKNQKRVEYTKKAKQVKASLQRDRRKWANNLAHEAEMSAQSGHLKGVYESTKKLCNSQNKKMEVVKTKTGKLLTSEKEILNRWKEHFSEILNRPDPVSEANISIENADQLNVNTGYASKSEIMSAVTTMGHNKAPWLDNITAELLKADINTTAEMFEPFFKNIWDAEEVPKDWKDGLIVKLPKQGDLSKCGNWRGLTLMSVPGKVLGKIILTRLRDAIDEKLRQEQAGFRKKRGTAEQIFILRNIVEQSIEWNSSLYALFVDYEKAFDSVHRETLWTIMKAYGIPGKFINIVRAFYKNSRAAVIHGTNVSDWFEILSGLRQGCVLSGFLFLLVIDWIMRKTLEQGKMGIRWKMTESLEDLDYADDIVLVAETWRHIQNKLDNMNHFGMQTGLKINVDKTKSLRINSNTQNPFYINGDRIGDVNHFKYLGAMVSTDGGADEDMKVRIGKARNAYYRLKKVWGSGQYSKKTKVRIFQSNVLSVLLYGCETWKMNEADEHKLDVFVNSCLRKILKIFWPNRISNQRLHEITGISKVSMEIRLRKWRYIGHILRKDHNCHERIALRWTPDGKRRRGRPKETWRRTAERERRTLGFNSWEAAAAVAKDRNRWRNLIRRPTLHKRR